MKLLTYCATACLVAATLLPAPQASAQVVLQGTRQIFHGDQRELTVRVDNPGQRAALVQAWTDAGDSAADPEVSNTPFVLRPPVFRLDAGSSRVLRVLLVDERLPQDRESIFWLNVLDVPPVTTTSAGNQLNFTLRTRVKLIYRPATLKDVRSAPSRLQWSLVRAGQGWGIQATNPTPYYVHFSTLGLRVEGSTYAVTDAEMIAPHATRVYPLNGLRSAPGSGNVQFQYINDQGGVVAQSTALNLTH